MGKQEIMIFQDCVWIFISRPPVPEPVKTIRMLPFQARRAEQAALKDVPHGPACPLLPGLWLSEGANAWAIRASVSSAVRCDSSARLA